MTAPTDGTAPETAGQETVVTGESSTSEKVFTQTEVNTLIADRLKREKEKYAKASNEAAEQARISSLSDNDKAIEEAKVFGRNEVLRENASKLAAAEIKVALSGLVSDPGSIVDDLNLTKYTNEDYSVNQDEVNNLRQKYEKLLGKKQNNSSATLQPGRSSSVTLAPDKSSAEQLAAKRFGSRT